MLLALLSPVACANPIDKAKMTAADSALAAQLNFDPKALLIVKGGLNAKLTSGPSKPYLTDQERDDLADKGHAAKLAEDLANFKSIAAKYPELAPAVEACLERANPPQESYSMNEAALRQMLSSGAPVPDFLKMFQSQNASPSAMKTIEARFDAVADIKKDILDVNKQLNDLDYNLTRVLYVETARRFASRAGALSFLVSNKTPVSDISLVESKGVSFDAIYPVDWNQDFKTPAEQLAFVKQANLKSNVFNKSAADYAASEVKVMRRTAKESPEFYFRQQERVLFLPDGAVVEKLLGRHWKITSPSRFVAKTSRYSALLVKIGNESFAQTLADYNINYLRQLKPVNDELVKALERWHKNYGAILVDPGMDGPLIRFKTLPDNLDALMMEIRQFSDESLSADENANAASARAAATALRADHCVRLQLTGKTAVVPRS